MAERPATKSYRDLLIWQRGMDLPAARCRIADRLPGSERFSLATQIRLAAASLPANTAEGYGRETDGPFSQLLRIAQGSLKELESYFLLLERMEMNEASVVAEAMTPSTNLGRMARAMVRSLKERPG